jgi:hypothetical protein
MEQEQEVTFKGYVITGLVDYEVEDDSFDHAFGTEHRCSAVAKTVDLTSAFMEEEGTVVEVEDLPKEIAEEAREKLLEKEFTGEFPDPSDEGCDDRDDDE